jgi:hypothetical protein
MSTKMPEWYKPPDQDPPDPNIQVSSAAPAKPMTKEERRKRFAELRSRMGRSQIEVTPPPGKAAFWASKDDTKELGRLQWIGYSIVHDNPDKPAWKANGMQQDGTYVIGDVILMEVDEEVRDMVQEEYLDRHESMLKNVKSTFISDAESQGVPAFEVAKPGMRR